VGESFQKGGDDHEGNPRIITKTLEVPVSKKGWPKVEKKGGKKQTEKKNLDAAHRALPTWRKDYGRYVGGGGGGTWKKIRGRLGGKDVYNKKNSGQTRNRETRKAQKKGEITENFERRE